MSVRDPRACPSCDAPSSDLVGIEVRGLYDGVAFFVCRSCAHKFVPHWEGDFRYHRFVAAMDAFQGSV